MHGLRPRPLGARRNGDRMQPRVLRARRHAHGVGRMYTVQAGPERVLDCVLRAARRAGCAVCCWMRTGGRRRTAGRAGSGSGRPLCSGRAGDLTLCLAGRLRCGSCACDAFVSVRQAACRISCNQMSEVKSECGGVRPPRVSICTAPGACARRAMVRPRTGIRGRRPEPSGSVGHASCAMDV